MADNKDTLLQRLQSLNLNIDEARIYLELLRGPSTHLKLARSTGINRTKVYRLADELEKRSLISVRNDDRGTFLIASDPATLEVDLVTEEERVKSKRQAFEALLPMLNLIKGNDISSFIVHNYEGEEGFKQMLWHELKATGEVLMFGRGSLEDLISNKRWIAQHQERMIQADFGIRELVNPRDDNDPFTINNRYHHRVISPEIIPLMEGQIITYNDTMAVYHWRHQQKVGVEIVNVYLAQTVRAMFEHFWQLAGPLQGDIAG